MKNYCFSFNKKKKNDVCLNHEKSSSCDRRDDQNAYGNPFIIILHLTIEYKWIHEFREKYVRQMNKNREKRSSHGNIYA